MSSTIEYAPTVALSKFVDTVHKRTSDATLKQPTVEMLKSSLSIGDDQLLIRFLGLMRKANAQIIKVLEQRPTPSGSEQYVNALKTIDTAMNPLNLGIGWNSIRHNYMNEETVIKAKAGYDIVCMISERYEIPVASIDEYTDQIKSLCKDIRETDLDDFIREYLLEELHFMVLSIERFELLGPDGVQAAFGNLLSAACRYQEVKKASWSNKISRDYRSWRNSYGLYCKR